jgi:hypothetical protein
MRNAQRILALGAMTLTAGAVLGMTATAASASTGQGGQATVAQPGPHDHDHDHDGNGNFNGNNGDHDRTWVAGRYNSRKTCQFFAWIGEQRGSFDEGKCVPGIHGKWLLIARDHGHHHGHHGHH